MYLVFGRGKNNAQWQERYVQRIAFALPHRGDLNVLLDKILRARSLIKKKKNMKNAPRDARQKSNKSIFIYYMNICPTNILNDN